MPDFDPDAYAAGPEPTAAGAFDPDAYASEPAASGDLRAMADAAADRHEIPRHLFRGMIQQESGWNPRAQPRDAGGNLRSSAKGLSQLIDSTAAGVGVQDAFDPAQNLEGGAKYLRQMYDQQGDWNRAVLAYHDGPKALADRGPSADALKHLDFVLKHADAALQEELDAQPQEQAPASSPADTSLAAFRASASTLSPDDGAEALDHAQSTGLSPGFVAGALPAVQQAQAQASTRASLAAAPVTAAFINRSPAHAAAAKDDVEHLSTMEWIFGRDKPLERPSPAQLAYAKANGLDPSTFTENVIPSQIASAFAKGIFGMRAALLGLKAGIPGVGLTEGDKKNLAQAQEYAAAPLVDTEGHLGRQMFGAVAEFLPQLPMFLGVGEVGLAKGIAAAALKGAPTSTVLALQTYGQMHNEFSAQRGNDGVGPKYTEDQVRALSYSGALATALILGGVGAAWGKGLVSGFLPKATAERVGEAAATSFVEKMLSSKAFSDNLAGRLAQLHESVLHGVGFMVAMAMIGQLTARDGEMMTGGKYDVSRAKAAIEQSVEAALLLLPLTLASPTVGLVRDLGRAHQAHVEALNLITQIEAAKKSKLIARAPGAARELLDAQAQADRYGPKPKAAPEPTDKTTLYMPVAAFDAVMREAGVDPAEAAKALHNDDGSGYQQAQATGQLAIPTADMLTQLAPEGLADKLLADMKTDPSAEAMTLREAAAATPLLDGTLRDMHEALTVDEARALYQGLVADEQIGLQQPIAADLSPEQRKILEGEQNSKETTPGKGQKTPDPQANWTEKQKAEWAALTASHAEAKDFASQTMAIYDREHAEMLAAGQTEEAAEVFANLRAKVATTLAQRYGGGPGEWHGKLGELRKHQGGAADASALAQPGTPAFKAWFGESKVVDENGAPLRMFHGTETSGFTDFSRERVDKKALYGPGFYFTDNPDVAGGYTDKGSGAAPAAGVYPVYLSIKKPFDVAGAAESLLPQLKQFKPKPPPPELRRMIDAALREAPDATSADGIGSWIDNTEWAYRVADRMGKGGEEIVLPYFDYIVGKARDQIVKDIKSGEYKTGEDVIKHIERNVFDVMQEGGQNIQDVLKMFGFDGITHIGGGIVANDGPKHRVFIAFEPTQIKSATGNSGAYDPKNPSILHQPNQVAAPWFSALERAADGAKQAKGTPESWLAVLSKTPGVKAEEIRETGVDKWLAEQKGVVSREQVAEYIKEHRVELHEKVLGEPDPARTERMAQAKAEEDAARVAFEALAARSPTSDTPKSMAASIIRTSNTGILDGEAYPELVESARALANASLKRRSLEKYDQPSETHYEEYTAGVHKPGTYRELLLTSPAAKDFDQPHFSGDAEGAIAHARIGETTDAQGRRVMMVEEIQSDLHQQGRKEGYDDPRERAAQREQMVANRKAVQAWLDQGDNAYDIRQSANGKFSPVAHNGNWGREFSTRAEALNAARQLHEGGIYRHSHGTASLNDLARLGAPQSVLDAASAAMRAEALAFNRKDGAAPDVPWKDTWEELMVRRLVRYAAEHGFERIALTPGEVHTKRYGTEQIAWEKIPSDTPGVIDPSIPRWRVRAKSQHGGEAGGINIEQAAAARGLVKERSTVVSTKAELAAVLDDSIGKTRHADKVWERMQKEDAGISQPRAEGFTEAYDRRLKGAFNKELKKYGGKMELEPVASDADALRPPQNDRTARALALKEASERLREYQGSINWSKATPEQRAELARLEGARQAASREMGGTAEVDAARSLLAASAREMHVADLPAALREKVLREGQPLFQRELTGTGGAALTLSPGAGDRGFITFDLPSDPAAPPRADLHFLAAADVSTGLHELGHFLLEGLARIAARTNAPEALKADVDLALRDIGYASNAERAQQAQERTILAGMADRTPEQTARLTELTAKEEKFSHLFETYLAEGKAPTSAVKALFARIKDLMLQVYGSIKAIAAQYKAAFGKDLVLSDAMRGFFDRLVAEDKKPQPEALRLANATVKEARDFATATAAYAEMQVAKLKIGELKPHVFEQQAQVHAARAMDWAKRLEKARADVTQGQETGIDSVLVRAVTAVLRDAQAKHLVADALAQASTRAKDAAAKVRDSLTATAKDKRREVATKADFEMAPEHAPGGPFPTPLTDGYDALHEAFGFRQRTGVPLAIEGAAAHLEGADRLAFDPEIVNEILRKPVPPTRRKGGNLDGLTLDEAQIVKDAAQNILHAARAVTEVVRAEKTATYVDQVRQIREHTDNRPKAALPAPSNAGKAAGEKSGMTIAGVHAEMLKPEMILRELGPVGEFYFDEFLKARNYGEELDRKIGDKLQRAIDSAPRELKRTRFDAIDGPPSPKLDNAKWVRQDVMMLFAWAGNEGSKERAIKGLGITEEQMHKTFDQLTKAEKDLVQSAIWDTNDQLLKPLLLEQSMKNTGVPMETVEAQPITTKDGVYAGGYHHASYNREASQKSAARGMAQGVADYYGDLKTGWAKGVGKGFTKSRVKGFYDVPNLNFSEFPAHLRSVSHYLAVDDFVKAFGGLLRRPDFRATIVERLGQAKLEQLDQFLATTARGKAEAPIEGARNLNRILGTAFRSRVATSAFSMNVPVVLMQLSHLGVADFALKLNPFTDLPIGIGNAFRPAKWAESHALSEKLGANELGYRWNNYGDKMRAMLANVGPEGERPGRLLRLVTGGDHPGRFGNAVRESSAALNHYLDVASWALYHTMDGFLSQAIWHATRAKAEAAGLPLEQQIKLADAGVRDTMPPMNLAEGSALMRDKGVAGSLMLIKRFPGVLYNLGAMNAFEQRAKAWDASPGWDRAKKVAGGTAVAAGLYLGMTTSAHLLGRYLGGHGRKKDEGETNPQWIARQGLSGLFYPVPFGEEVATPFIEKLVNKKEITRQGVRGVFRSAPAVAFMEDEITKLGEAFNANKPIEDRYFAASEVIMRAKGIPVAPIKQVRTAIDVARGKTRVRGLLDAADKLTYGQQKPGQKRDTNLPYDLNRLLR